MTSYRFITSQEISPDILSGINSLLSQLNPECQPVTVASLKHILTGNHLLLAFDSSVEVVIGMATLSISHKISSPDYGTIEDVVVDSGYRGRGIGKELTSRLIAKAKNLKLHHLDLTSNPSRIAANQMYQSLGFTLRSTNCYRFLF